MRCSRIAASGSPPTRCRGTSASSRPCPRAPSERSCAASCAPSTETRGIEMNVQDYLPPDLFKGKTVFVTGGGSGINLGVASTFATLGANLAICGRTQDKLEQAAIRLRELGRHAGAKVLPVAADVRDPQALEAAF